MTNQPPAQENNEPVILSLNVPSLSTTISSGQSSGESSNLTPLEPSVITPRDKLAQTFQAVRNSTIATGGMGYHQKRHPMMVRLFTMVINLSIYMYKDG